ncbi:MAG: hypothetical protein ABEJ65_03595 [bacterium]
MDTDVLPGGIPHNDTGLQAFGRTAFLLEFSDSENRILGSDTTTTEIRDTFSYVAEYVLSRETTRKYNRLGFDTSAGSDDFHFNFADTYGATWQSDTSTVTVDTNALGGISVRVAVLNKDLPGSLGGATSTSSSSSGGSSCLIERAGTPESVLTGLREARDWMLSNSIGRVITSWYYGE